VVEIDALIGAIHKEIDRYRDFRKRLYKLKGPEEAIKEIGNE